jgi:hypothetical protein
VTGKQEGLGSSAQVLTNALLVGRSGTCSSPRMYATKMPSLPRGHLLITYSSRLVLRNGLFKPAFASGQPDIYFLAGGAIASLVAFATRNFTTVLALIWIGSPVCGLRPMRALR